MRRYLPGTVLLRWRTRLSVSVRFSPIEAASRERCKDWVCTGGKKCVEKFRNTGKVAGNPGRAVRGVCRSMLKRTVIRIWREGICSSKYKPENSTCWMRTVLAEWERYLQQFGTGWNVSDRSYFPFLFEIPPEHIIRGIVCTCDPWDVHNVIRTCSQARYFFTYTCMNCPPLFVYIII